MLPRFVRNLPSALGGFELASLPSCPSVKEEAPKRGPNDNKSLWPTLMEPSKAVVGLEADAGFKLPPPNSPAMKKLLEAYDQFIKLRAINPEDPTRSSTAGALVDTSSLPQTPEAVDGTLSATVEEREVMDRNELELPAFMAKSGVTDAFYADSKMFRVGDLVICNSVLGMIIVKAKRHFVLLTSLGAFVTVYPAFVRFHVPDFLATKLAVSFIEATLSEEVVRRLVAGEAVKEALPLLSKLVSVVDTRATSFNMLRYRDLVQLAGKYQHDVKEVEIQVAEAGQALVGREPEPYELVGLFRFFAANTIDFSKCQEKSNTMVVHSRARVARYTELLALASRPGALDGFISKAAKLIKYRAKAFPTQPRIINATNMGFSPHKLERAQNRAEQPDPEVTFDPTDRKIIRGIWDFVLAERAMNVSPLLPLVNAILKPLSYSYVCSLDALEFLKDIGAAQLFENPWYLELSLSPPPAAPGALDDTCAAIRQDFGERPVYTIDSPDAKEIDDGVSIDLVAGTRAWLHVHIADPTVVVAPGSELDNHCLRHPTTVYTPDSTFPMLPQWLTHGPCSLSSAPGTAKYVMTFSALLDRDGAILDFKIQPSLVRNIIPVSYERVNAALGFESSLLERGSHPFSDASGGAKPAEGPAKGSAEEVIKDLKDLSRFAFAHFRKRQGDGCLFIDNTNLQMRVAPQPFKRTTDLSPSAPSYDNFGEMPVIKYQLERSNPRSSNNMVAECMVIAGRVAARYLKQNKLPALYPNQLAPDLTTSPDLAMLLKRLAVTKEPMPYEDFIHLRDHLNFAFIDTAPGTHFSMGLHDGYVRVTSPLRRYLDMVHHWQIKHHLLNPTKPPKFSQAQLNATYASIHTPLAKMRLLERRCTRFWLLNYLARIEAQCRKDPAAIGERFPTVVAASVWYNKDNLPQAIYRGKLLTYLPEKDEWVTALLPFNVATHLSTIGYPDPAKLHRGAEVEMVLMSLIPDFNIMKFAYLPTLRLRPSVSPPQSRQPLPHARDPY
ncbi:3'-5' RNA exonuclease complex component [Massospora cicadina]|nr:3'-5' RNA exonuclease complex component [Massospora cicadina]